jgi:pyridoxamine 5'-phosphate oxidase
MSLADLRKEYCLAGLTEAELDPHPIPQFQKWFDQALKGGLAEPNAMTLATADKSGRPSARVVLLKGVDERGFSFFTNYESRKGRELAENPQAALAFYWAALERQVCVSGSVSQLPPAESEAYFKIRPRGSRLAAWASKQSQVIRSRAELEERMRQFDTQHLGEEVPLPPFWGGYVLSPVWVEFWQGRPNRLHDRFVYTKQSDNRWRIDRLSP